MVYLFFEIHPEDASKILRLKAQTDSSYSGIFYAVYEGSQMEIWQYYFKQYGAELIVAFLILILSIISIIGSMVLRLCYHQKVDLEYLGWGVLIAGIWLITNSVFRQLIFPNLSVVNDIIFYMIMLLPLPYLFYLDGIQKDLILLDYEMPGMDGKATFEAILADEFAKDIPVVFLTSIADRKQIYAVLKSYPAGYILKPPDKEKLFSTIETVFQREINFC